MTIFMSNTMKKGDVYKAFDVLNVFDVPDYHSTAIHLRHQKTGLEVFHMHNDDTENLFAFAFRTPNPKSNGAAHIIEHSVLCGSERFPLKDPFVVLSNQSVKTYLNAMTYSDKTVYPASSIAKVDYFNLMSVYGDAVFFPRLQKEIFMQEAHRLELDENGTPSIQGVVYNEMKGSYSSFEAVASDYAISSLMDDCIYKKDSGGDPLEIPTITYEDFVAFHKRWYRPDNCLLFLYGNIPTTEQLDFVQDTFLSRLEKKYPDIDVSESARKKQIADFLACVTPRQYDKPIDVYCEGPAGDGESLNTVLVNWNIGRSNDATRATERVVLASILCNHDGSPLQKALLESGLGEDIAPQLGLFASVYTSILTVGLRGVKKGDEKKVEALVLETIRHLVEKGISEKDIDATLMSMEYSQREIKRGQGPYALSLMARPIYGWLYGDGVENQIRLRSHLEAVKAKIKNDDTYLRTLMKSVLLDNTNRSLVVVTPSSAYTERRERAEKDLIQSLLKKTNRDAIKTDTNALHAFQQKEDDTSCLPHLNPSDFITDGKPFMNRTATTIGALPACNGGSIPFIKNEEPTNGIIYLDVGFPVDVLSVADYPVLPLFAECVTECGWKDLDWARSAEETALYTGGIGVNLLTMEGPDTPNSRAFRQKHNWIDRDWLIFRLSMVEEQCEHALSLLRDCITGVDFSDEKRLRDLITETENDFDSSVIPDGHIFTSTRVCAQLSRKSAVDEIWNGLSQYFTIKEISAQPLAETIATFKRLLAQIRAGGAFIHVTAEQTGCKQLESLLPDFIEQVQISEIADARSTTLSDFIPFIKQAADDPTETFVTSSQIGYASQCIPAARYGTKESYTEEVCTHWLANNLLWEKVRTIGGAYGVFCNTESMIGSVLFSSYRDPSPFDTCAVFGECLKEASEIDFDDEEVARCVMGCYSHFIQPQSPKGRGSVALTRVLYGILDEDREKKILGILSTTAADLKHGFYRLYENMKRASSSKKAIICGKKALEACENAGKIVSLPL